MLKSHISCVLLTVCGLSFALVTLSGEVADFLRACGKSAPVYAHCSFDQNKE